MTPWLLKVLMSKEYRSTGVLDAGRGLHFSFLDSLELFSTEYIEYMEKHPVLADLKSDRIEKKHLQCYKLWGITNP